tara:strand:- start:1236 stop:1682 length:447 start_codon:yes stop_codon:yes gene_type:complete
VSALAFKLVKSLNELNEELSDDPEKAVFVNIIVLLASSLWSEVFDVELEAEANVSLTKLLSSKLVRRMYFILLERKVPAPLAEDADKIVIWSVGTVRILSEISFIPKISCVFVLPRSRPFRVIFSVTLIVSFALLIVVAIQSPHIINM